MRFFYQSGAMGMGKGYAWHKWLGHKFPRFPIVTKTITLEERKGHPYRLLVDPLLTKSMWNKIGLHNRGFYLEMEDLFWNNTTMDFNNLIISIAGSDDAIQAMVFLIDSYNKEPAGIELNFSCPNVSNYENKTIPRSEKNIPLYLKLNHRQTPFDYDLTNIKEIHVNSVGLGKYGAISGGLAKQTNWDYMKRYLWPLRDAGVELAASSWCDFHDMYDLNKFGFTTFGIGSIIMTNPQCVKQCEQLYFDTDKVFLPQAAIKIKER